MKILLRVLGGVGLIVLAIEGAVAQRVGDEWIERRGGGAVGQPYYTITQTGTGRLIAVGDGGALMISDDGGTNWSFRQIQVAGKRVKGIISDIEAFGGATSVVALMTELVDAPGGDFAYSVKTTLLKSIDNGQTWTSQEFPHQSTFHFGQTFYGVDLTGLHVSPANELIAYGTTTVTEQAVVFWSTGGLIYRSSDATNWTEAKFAFGALTSVADAGGRMVASGLSTVLDSADGAGWNGYPMANASITPPGGDELPFETRRALWLLDIVFHDGNYIAQTAQFIPKDGFISTGSVDALYTLIAPTPFDGARQWTAHEQPRLYGRAFVTGSGIAGIGPGAFTSPTGQSWTLADGTVVAPEGATVKTGASTLVTVGSSHAAWKSTDGGSTWTRTLTPPVEPDLWVLGTFGGTVFARGNSDLYASEDNGLTWQFRSDESVENMVEVGNRLITHGGGSQSVRVSDDRGFTWQTRTVDASSSAASTDFTRTPTGRAIMATVGSLNGTGTFYVSDDAGESWSPRPSGLGFGAKLGAFGTSARGTIIGTKNTMAVFDPQLVISTDNGDTWSTSDVLQSQAGLDGDDGSGSPTTFIEVFAVRASPTGRILLLGDDEILTSDDEGETWTVRINLDKNQTETGFFRWRIWDVVYTGSRWIAVGNYKTPSPDNKEKDFAMTSDDDGTTWKWIDIPLVDSSLYSLAVGLDGRIIAGGSNAAVYSTDAFSNVTTESPIVTVREGTTGQLTIERPPLPGEITATYGAIDRVALAGQDYVATSGDLTWQEDDPAPKVVDLATINNALRDGDRELVFQLTFETDDLKGANEIPVLIEDDEGTGNFAIQLVGRSSLYTTEQGGTAELKIALERPPGADVTLTVTGLDPTEGTLSATSFVFTSANWNVQQILTITGVDDDEPDGDSSYDLHLDPSSSDSNFNKLFDEIVSVVNIGDEPYDSGIEPPVTPPVITPTTAAAAPDHSAAIAALLKKIKKLKKKAKTAKKKMQVAKVKKYKKKIKSLTAQLRAL